MFLRHFTFVMSMFVFIAFSYGFAGPFLISSSDTIMTLAGFLYTMFIVPLVVWYFVIKYIKIYFKTNEENN